MNDHIQSNGKGPVNSNPNRVIKNPDARVVNEKKGCREIENWDQSSILYCHGDADHCDDHSNDRLPRESLAEHHAQPITAVVATKIDQARDACRSSVVLSTVEADSHR